MTTALLRQALDALENGRSVWLGEGGTQWQQPLEDAAIAAINEALAQPVQTAEADKVADLTNRLHDANQSIGNLERNIEVLIAILAQPVQPAMTYEQAMHIYTEAQRKWDSEADSGNQWGALGRDEMSLLIVRETELQHGIVEPARGDVLASGQIKTGFCKQKAQPGGCPMDNLQCGWPDCDQQPAEVKHG